MDLSQNKFIAGQLELGEDFVTIIFTKKETNV